MVWFGNRLALTTVGASTSVLLGSLNAAALLARPFTIVRTRLVVWYDSDQESANEFSQAVFSQQVVTEAASTAGIGSIPTPATETDADYYVYQPLFQKLGFITGVGFDNRGADQSWVVDSKAMRKVGPDDDAVLVIENNSAVGCRIAIEGRMLVKFH